MNISLRLKKVASLIDKDSILLDIGCDHAYLPIYAIKEKIVKKAYAVDNKIEPLNNASVNIQLNNLSEFIIPILSDGFKNINVNDYDTVTICGMGSDTIIDIMKNNINVFNKTFIIESNKNNDLLRKYLVSNGYSIIDEDIVYDSGFYYQIIKAKYSGINSTLDKKELLYGPINLNKNKVILSKLIRFQLDILNKNISDNKNHELKDKISFLEGVLDEIR